MSKELFLNAANFQRINEMNPIDFKLQLEEFLKNTCLQNDWKENSYANRKILEYCHKFYGYNTLPEIINAFDLYLMGSFNDILDKKYQKIDSVNANFFIKIINLYNEAKRKTLNLTAPTGKAVIDEEERKKIMLSYIPFWIKLVDEDFNPEKKYLIGSLFNYDLFIRWGLIPESERGTIKTAQEKRKGFYAGLGSSFSELYEQRIKKAIMELKQSGRTMQEVLSIPDNVNILLNVTT